MCGLKFLGQKVFEWDQTLEEVNMYINLPQNVPSKQFFCKIQSKHVEVGIKGNPPYLNVSNSVPFDLFPQKMKFLIGGLNGAFRMRIVQHDLTSPVKTDCSFWTLGN